MSRPAQLGSGRRRAGRLLPVAAAVLLAVTAGALGVPAHTPEPAADDGCPAAFPVRVTPEGSGMYGTALARLVVCRTETGTGTLVRNGTPATWVLEGLRGTAVHREPGTAVERSFLDLAGGPDPVLPPGASLAVATPASRVVARVDPRLTIAGLAHERLAAIILSVAPAGSARSVVAASRDALATCLSEMLERVPLAGALLSRGNPGRRITDAAAEVAADQDSACVRRWNAARLATAAVGAPITTLAQDAEVWRRDRAFALRALEAAITYSALDRRRGP